MARAKAGDRAAQDQVIRHNTGLVVRIIRSRGWYAKDSDFDDLLQAGRLALLKSIEKFDPAFGVMFSTYASYWVRMMVARETDSLARARAVGDCFDDFPAQVDPDADIDAARAAHAAKLRLLKAMQRLLPREREVIAIRYLRQGIAKRESLESIGQRWGVSRERVRQIEVRAMYKIKRFAE